MVRWDVERAPTSVQLLGLGADHGLTSQTCLSAAGCGWRTCVIRPPLSAPGRS